MISQPILEVLENILRISSNPVCLHYDTVFNVGDFYLSTISFHHCMLKKNPVIPFGFLIHSRRFHEDHLNFLSSIRKLLPLLATKAVVIVTDQEFNFSEVFPVGTHVFCWNHLERDLHFI